jgi:drug/metabolite transporter (DMT)-like permease
MPVPEASPRRRRWNVITSGLLIAILALIVTFTTRAAFLSPTAIVVVAAVGVVALMLQLRLRRGEVPAVHSPTWLNIAGTLFALAAFLGDLFSVRSAIREVLALIAVGCFVISGGMVLRELRKRPVEPKR